MRKQLNAIKAAEFPWMAEVTKCAPQVAIKNVGLAFDHFFRRLKLGQKPGYPRFKRKGIRDSFRADNGPQNASSHAVQVVGSTVKLPRCGVVRMREELRFAGRVLGATVSRMADGWYVALSVETEERLRAVEDRGAVGVDLGIKTLATFSDGGGAPAQKPHRAEHKRMARLSRSLSRKQKGSANRAKAKAKLARLHLRIANVRKDALQADDETRSELLDHRHRGFKRLGHAEERQTRSCHRRCRILRVPPSTGI
ncbi:putative transposase [Paraburkholderia rhizosphaerae]|uniref:Putative transposase n=1 Tax=Paraburkholderia rhizosphaerae TaxID=480658 RepID=A0A4R8LPL1_9BURK|nr:putative transposase [Paraburkholderia rhizosphaerae]